MGRDCQNIAFATATIIALALPAAAQQSAPAETDKTAASQQETQPSAPQQILFIGNSYFYYNDSLHNHTRRMAIEGTQIPEDDLDYRSVTISGGSLDMHPIAHYLTPGAIGYDDAFDIVVLQGNSAAAESDTRSERFRAAVREMDAEIRDSGAETMLYMTHAYAEGHERYSEDGTDRLDQLYTEMGAEIGAEVIPVGLAFAEARRQRPDLALQQDFDNSHPTLAGTYLASAVVFATVYGETPEALEYDYFGRIPSEDAAFLRQIAQETVTAYQSR
ncbi:hypothetical protein SAMN05421538_1148 [Paracoccus isoporae]|uniref:SGNH/GDSL hydrolase family protein n=1 Tax=Paracoccus isoporae TaxID=591205 RepID=A0A1G7GM34_9RHOB|nr:DUF4886 domain-containing protein [Paracoccus isoporae]SDE89164.1 hypothetical protein SAMN05421538_1148 [Paracoccus isoporae]